MKNYYFDEKQRFVIENYNSSKPFASFLPGIAGKKAFRCGSFTSTEFRGLLLLVLPTKTTQ